MAVDSLDRRGDSVLDLGSFMTHYNRVRDQLWPLGKLIEEISRVRR